MGHIAANHANNSCKEHNRKHSTADEYQVAPNIGLEYVRQWNFCIVLYCIVNLFVVGNKSSR